MPALAERLPLTLRAYALLTAVATPLVSFLLRRRLKRGKEHPRRLTERRGETTAARPRGTLVWVHGASVGELAAAIPLVGRLRERGLNVLVTTGTVTSAALAAKRLPPGAIHQFAPLDAPIFIARFLKHWRPDLALFVESDLWPNTIMAAAERRIPLILVNGRLSARSFERWRYLPGTIETLLKRIDLCLVRTTADAERFDALGAPRITTTGNLKLDVPPLPVDEDKLARLSSMLAGRPVFAAASTHLGEETAIIDTQRRLKASFRGLLTIVVPRHPERGPSIADAVAAGGLTAALRSRGQLPQPGTDIYIADTLGELGLFYRLAGVAFIGGSLTPMGGHNPLEAALLDCALLHGPDMSNCAGIARELASAKAAVTVQDGATLGAAVAQLLGDPVERARRAAAALEVAGNNRAVLDAVLERIAPWLDRLTPHAKSAYA